MSRLALVGAALIAVCGPIFADDCDPVRKAARDTLQAPGGWRQYMAAGGRPERLVSIAKGDTVWLALGPGQWTAMPRRELLAEASNAEAGHRLSQCHAHGESVIDGMPVTVYDYASQVGGLPVLQAQAWIGRDGLIYRQSSGRQGVLRYEFKNVQAPQ